MVKASITASFPSALVTRKNIGKFTNNEGVVLSQDSDSGTTTLNTESAPSNIEADNYLFAITQDGPLLVQVTAVDAAAQTVTVDRPVDGTTDVDMKEGARLVAAVPARAMNRLAAEQVAVQAWLGKDGDTVTWDRNLILQPSTTDGTYPLTIDILSGHADPEPFIQFRRSTDSGTTYTSVGSINYDPTNDELEFHNITLTAGTAADILLEDDRSLYLGTDKDARFLYDSGDDRVEYRSDKVLRIEQADGTEALTLTPTTRLNLVGAFSIGGTDVLEADRDQAISWVPNADGTLTAGTASRRYSEVHTEALHVENAAGDANSITQVDASGYHAGAGGASTLDVLMARQAASVYEVTGSLAGSVRVGMSGAGEALLALRAAAADANPYALLNQDGLAFGAGGASATDVLLSRGAADRLDLATGDDLNLVSGAFQIASTTIFASDRDQSISWVPDTDNSLTAATASRRYSEAHAVQFDVESSAGDANPVARLTTTGLLLGGGGASALDGLLKRGSSTQWALRNAADNAYIGLDLLELTIGGTQVFEDDRDFAIDLLPNADNTHRLGSPSRRVQQVDTVVLRAFAAGGDANPTAQLSAGTGLSLGPGGASGLDWRMTRSAQNLALINAGDHLQVDSGDIRFDDNSFGVVLKDDAATPHYWRVTIDSSGTLVTSDLGTSLPST